MKKSRIPYVFLTSLGIVIGFFLGLVTYRFELFPVPQIRMAVHAVFDDGVDRIGFRDTRERTPVDCGMMRTDTTILLAFGQSNSANHGETRFTPAKGVYNFNFFDGKCYRAADPLLGATGNGGSVWSRLGNMLVVDGRAPRVLIAPIGVNASSIARWTPEGDLYPRVRGVIRGLAVHGLEPTHLLWHQGEADAMLGTSQAEYEARFERMLDAIRKEGVAAPVFVAVTSICQGPGSAAIRSAQRAIAQKHAGVRQGANSDRLDRMSMRYDGCHFSADGLRRHAELWFAALTGNE